MNLLKKTALGMMLVMLSLFTGCTSLSQEDVELIGNVAELVIDVAGQMQETAAEEKAEAETKAETEAESAEEAEAETEAESAAGEEAEAEAAVQESETEVLELTQESLELAETLPEITEEMLETSGTWLGVVEDGEYTSVEEVSLYLNLYGHLPDNYITKKEARKLGWDSSKGNLWDVAPGMSIGGDYFGNYEGNLPEEKGRDYYECDIDYEGGYRNEKRIVFSDDGLIFYTEDHYNTFEQLY